MQRIALLMIVQLGCIGVALAALTEIIQGKLNYDYNDTVSQGSPDVYAFRWDLLDGNDTIRPLRLLVESNASEVSHLTVVVRETIGVLAWAVPFSVEGGLGSYANSSRTVCPDLTNITTEQVAYVDISTAANMTIGYDLRAWPVLDYSLSAGMPKALVLSPPAPVYYSYRFEPEDEFVRVVLTSPTYECAIVSVQSADCPVYDLGRDILYSGAYQTFTTQAAVTVERTSIRGDRFHVVVLGLSDEAFCHQTYQHELLFPGGSPGARVSADDVTKTLYYGKNVTVLVVQESRDYHLPVLATIAVFLATYALVFLVLAINYGLQRDHAGLTLLQYVFASCNPKGQDIARGGGDGGGVEDGDCDANGHAAVSITTGTPSAVDGDVSGSALESLRRARAASHKGYGATDVSSTDDTAFLTAAAATSPDHNDADDVVDREMGEPGVGVADGSGGGDARCMSCCWCAACDRVFSPNSRMVTVADITRNSPEKLDQRLSSYPWVISIVAVFYGLPVIQLVYNYQTVLNLTGNQDLCYYNFRCIHRLGNLSAFNNVFSNVGYILLGVLFMFLTWRRHRLYRYQVECDSLLKTEKGLPQHFGLFYTLGLSLCMEGIMSGCYHVCPTRLNFQFDTSFMYIIACVSLLRLYQNRHPDVIGDAHKTAAFFALLIFVVVCGVLNTGSLFWAIFFVLYLFGILFINLHLYFFSWDEMMTSARSVCKDGPFPIHFPRRFTLLLMSTCLNMALAIYGISLRQANFPGYVLNVLLANLFVYIFYYAIMKWCHGEAFRPLTWIFMAVMVAFSVPALYFYLSSVTSWQKSPSESRQLNKDCILLDFYDNHDVWHFFSAGSLFFYSMVLLTIDDRLAQTPRNKIISW